jgi:hypothetical protein
MSVVTVLSTPGSEVIKITVDCLTAQHQVQLLRSHSNLIGYTFLDLKQLTETADEG